MIEETGSRRRLYWDLHDFGRGRGLEIGPLHRAMVHRDEADVRYVDVHDQETLRAHYGDDPNVPKDAIPEIDYTLIQDDGSTLPLTEAAKPGAPFEWVVASHVIEHVPDVIGWLEQLAELVADDGVLVLAVPDKRFCFDVHRPSTSVGALLQAHLSGDTRPSVRAVYDHFSSAVDNTSQDLWQGRYPAFDRRIHTLGEAHQKVEEAVAGSYVDCHVWLFSPNSFLEQMYELRISGLSSWVVEELIATPVDDLEFRVRMRRLPREVDSRADQPAEVRSPGERPDWLEDQVAGSLVRRAEQKNAQLEQRVARLRERMVKVKARSVRRDERQRRAINAQRRQLEALRASRQWQLGGVVLAPLRLVRRARARHS